jgi:hypothetical protein
MKMYSIKRAHQAAYFEKIKPTTQHSVPIVALFLSFVLFAIPYVRSKD